MIDAKRFDLIKRKHGGYASWAVWAPPSGRPKSNMGDLSVLDERSNPALLEALRPGVVMIGFNISRFIPEEPFRNFHDPRPMANDFKIRHAFKNTDYWGAYMTDVIKGFVEPTSGQLLAHLRRHPQIVRDNLNTLREELRDLGHARPVILAFGRATHSLLAENLNQDDYSLLVLLTHYGHRISKEEYRNTVHREILRAQQGAVQHEHATDSPRN